MPTFRLDDEAGYRTFAEQCGCTLAQIKLAIESVGYDQLDVLSFLRRRGWLTDGDFERQKNLLEGNLPKVESVTSEYETSVVSTSNSGGASNPSLGRQNYAESSEKFREFLRQKMVRNHALQDAYNVSQASGYDEIAMLRMMVIALVEANDVLSRGTPRKG